MRWLEGGDSVNYWAMVSLKQASSLIVSQQKPLSATLDDSHLTVHMLCNSCGCIYCSISLYQNISDYHCISFHDKLTAYCGASDQFDLKLEITAYNAESKEVQSCSSR